jgi:translation elongation factor EF-1alpha
VKRIVSDWSEVDFVIVRRKMGEDQTVEALEGRVVEEGEPREQPLELTVPQVIDYIAGEGNFYTGRETLGRIELGGELEIVDEGDEVRLRTIDGTEEEYFLNALPTYHDSDSDGGNE